MAFFNKNGYFLEIKKRNSKFEIRTGHFSENLADITTFYKHLKKTLNPYIWNSHIICHSSFALINKRENILSSLCQGSFHWKIGRYHKENRKSNIYSNITIALWANGGQVSQLFLTTYIYLVWSAKHVKWSIYRRFSGLRSVRTSDEIKKSLKF